MVASRGAYKTLWIKEKDLVSMTRAEKTIVKFNIRLRGHQPNSQGQDEDEE